MSELLGSGAYGEVYLAEDLERGGRVALKSLRRADPTALAQFKQEFRALADLVHPNLVQLFELFADGERWYFTMEYVPGQRFLDYIWSSAEPITPVLSTPTGSSGSLLDDATLDDVEAPAPRSLSGSRAVPRFLNEDDTFAGEPNLTAPPVPSEDNPPIVDAPFLDRLRRSFIQLTRGVLELHQSNKLHRDLKPSNVLATAEGRIVILDFGLILELEQSGLDQAPRTVTGTPGYMSPEQVEKEPLGTASDWYAVGVMLYQSLTGALPFDGTPQQVLALKTAIEAPPVLERNPAAPPELAALCASLLRREAGARAGGEDVLRAMGAAVTPRAEDGALPFVGRRAELARLREAWAEARSGGAALAAVFGPSGIGKSSLIERFLGEVEGGGEALVLRGRCYQQESVPFKVWDPLIDAIARFLRGLSDAETALLEEEDLPVLLRVFPTLRQVKRFAKIGGVTIADPQEIQRRAFAAIKRLLRALAELRPLVLYVDDLQWGDLDSALLLERVLAPPHPALLFVASYRSEDLTTSPMLQRLLKFKAPRAVIELGGLSRDDLRELGAAVSEDLAGLDLDALARDSGGSPLFASELLRSSGARGEEVHLDELILERVRALPKVARRLLEHIAISGRPLGLPVARSALTSGLQEALGALRAGNFIRSIDSPSGERMESYHDRIRESVVAGLAADELRATRLSLARAIEAAGEEDDERLAELYNAAGEQARALSYAEKAAARAYEALAFDRSARLYRLAYQCGAEDSLERRVRLGDALANARRGREAAREYLSAAAATEDAERALELRSRACQHYFASGHLEEGMETTRGVLASVGMALPKYTVWDKLGMARRWLRLRYGSLDFELREESEVAPELLRRVDACWTVTSAMNSVDVMASIDFNNRMLIYALEAGEPARIVRALSAYAYLLNSLFRIGRRPQLRRSRQLLDRAAAIADRLGDPYPTGFVALLGAVCAFVEGRYRRAVAQCEQALTIFRERCVGVSWELDNCYCFRYFSLTALGEARLLSAELPPLVDEAKERENLYGVLTLGGVNLSWHYLYADRLEEGEAAVRENLALAARGVGRDAGLHVWGTFASFVEQALYRGDHAWARRLLEQCWPGLVKDSILELQWTRTHCYDARARILLAEARAGVADHRREVAGLTRRLEREPVLQAEPLSRLLRAQTLALAGREGDSFEELIGAERRFRELDMAMHAAVCQRQRGVLLKDQGGRHRAAAEDWMSSQGIQNPAGIAAALAPGLSET